MDFAPVLVSAITAFCATMSAGLLIRRFKHNFGVVCAFASGTMIALVVFDITPAIVLSGLQTGFSMAFPVLSAVLGFVFLYALVGFFQGKKNATGKRRIGLISTAEFCSHGFLEGLAIGVGFTVQFGLGLVVAVAVISHGFCDGLSTLALMLNSGNSVKASLGMLFVSAVAPLLGAATILFLPVSEGFLLLALSFLAGSFVYIGGFNLLPEAYSMNKPKPTVLLFSAGFLVISSLSLLNS